MRSETAALRERLSSSASQASPAEHVTSTEHAITIIERGLERRVGESLTSTLVRVINATGVILHTNLGRAPLGAYALTRLNELATGYLTLEYDLSEGKRGARDTHAESLLRRLTGAEAAVVTNNNAAATMLMLAALAAGREVIISRGELVEIGGGFRVPDVMAQSGAILREVGTTNRTRISDYAAAITDRTGLILRVHPSNFRIEGFTERPSLAELTALGRQFNVLVAEDLGSGFLGKSLALVCGGRASALLGTGRPAGLKACRHERADELPEGDTPDLAEAGRSPLREEPSPQSTIAGGADVVCFSGDKLLGGPQAGIIIGRREPISRIRKHPLMRALRVDKLTYTALEATLVEYATGRAPQTIPALRMIELDKATITKRAQALLERIKGNSELKLSLRDGFSTVGGGSAPGSKLETCLIVLEHEQVGANDLEAALRRANPPVIARIEDDRVVIDLRTVLPDEEHTLATIIEKI